jgi:hypothetical protein
MTFSQKYRYRFTCSFLLFACFWFVVVSTTEKWQQEKVRDVAAYMFSDVTCLKKEYIVL